MKPADPKVFVLCVISLLFGSPQGTTANVDITQPAVTPAPTPTGSRLLLGSLTPTPSLSQSANQFSTDRNDAFPNTLHIRKSQIKAPPANTTKSSLISLGPLEILGYLFKASSSTPPPSLSTSNQSSIVAPLFNETQHEKLPHTSWSTANDTNRKDTGDAVPSHSRSYLLLLAGNATIVQLRQKDFAKYLKLNLAARLSLDYDDVMINQVIVAPPRLLVNISVVSAPPPTAAESTVSESMAPESSAQLAQHFNNEVAPLHLLAETNATLLELSGEEYHVLRLLSQRQDPLEEEYDEDGDFVLDDGGGDEDDNELPLTTITYEQHAGFQAISYIAGAICIVGVLLACFRLAVQKYKFSSLSCLYEKVYDWIRGFSRYQIPPEDDNFHVIAKHKYIIPQPPIYSGPFVTNQSNWIQDDNERIPISFSRIDHPFDLSFSTNHPSPSKLHIYSCRPDSVVLQIPYHYQYQRGKI